MNSDLEECMDITELLSFVGSYFMSYGIVVSDLDLMVTSNQSSYLRRWELNIDCGVRSIVFYDKATPNYIAVDIYNTDLNAFSGDIIEHIIYINR